MSVSRDMVQRVARLAGLRLDPAEEEEQVRNLARIVEYVDRLGELMLEEDEEAADHRPPELRLREDEPRPCLDVEEVLGAAPDRAKDFFRVPIVVSRGDAGEDTDPEADG